MMLQSRPGKDRRIEIRQNRPNIPRDRNDEAKRPCEGSGSMMVRFAAKYVKCGTCTVGKVVCLPAGGPCSRGVFTGTIMMVVQMWGKRLAPDVLGVSG